MGALAGLPRRWWTIGVPGILENRRATYWEVPLDDMPPVDRAFDASLDWLLDSAVHDESSIDDGVPARRADAIGLRQVAPGLELPQPFRRFIEDPEPRRHVRSATACYLDLGHDAVRLGDVGVLVHFLSDQQWIRHWLLFVGEDGSEGVVTSPEPIGFHDEERAASEVVDVDVARDDLVVCSDSFEEFLYRYWVEQELFFTLAVDATPLGELRPELRTYALGYPRHPS